MYGYEGYVNIEVWIQLMKPKKAQNTILRFKLNLLLNRIFFLFIKKSV
jgi:hypothetical protein